MKINLSCYLDISPDSNPLARALLPGDEIDIKSIHQYCPDPGCCEVKVVFTHADIPGEIEGWAMFSNIATGRCLSRLEKLICFD